MYSQGWSLAILGGVSRAKIIKGKYEEKLEIPGNNKASNQKKNPWKRHGYLESHIDKFKNPSQNK